MRPLTWIRVQGAESVLRLAVGGEIGQVHVVIALGQECIAQGSKHAWFVTAEVVREN